MSGALADPDDDLDNGGNALAQAAASSNGGDDDDQGGAPSPLDPDSVIPRQPRMAPRQTGGLGDPQLAEGNKPKKPLLRQEIVERIARDLIAKNLADDMPEDEQGRLASQAKEEYELDDATRTEWKTRYKQWLDFALQVQKGKTYPWPGAADVIFPLITVAALSFNARSYPAIVQGQNVVKGEVIGDDRGQINPAFVMAAMALQQQQQAAQQAQLTGPSQAPLAGSPGQEPLPAIAPPSPPPQAAQPAPGPGAPGPGMVGPGMGAPQQLPPQYLVQPGAKQARADRIGRHMSWQLLHEMPEWEAQTDRLLLVTPIVGCLFRKTYYDPSKMRNVSETVDAMRVVVNYKAKSFEDAPRVTEEIDFYPWEIETMKRSGLWLDGDYGHNIDQDSQDQQAPVTFCEQQRRYDLDGDGYEEPIIVTFARDSGKLARVVLGFDEEGIEATSKGEIQQITPIRILTKYGFIPNPDGGVYDIGFGHLLYPINSAINTSLNQLFDAGHLANTGGGFIGGGMSINAGSIRFTVGEFKVVQTQGRALRENIVPMPFPGPNQVLFELMQYLVEAAKEIASINNVLSGEIPGANVPGILGLAVIQQGLKVFNAIFKRMHRSLGAEFEKLFRLNRLYLPEEAGYTVGSEYFQIARQDYEEGAGVAPVSDPDMVTDAQQMAQANFLSQFLPDPFFNGREIRMRMLTAAAVPQIDKLLLDQAPPNAEITGQLAQLDLQKRMLDLREQELNIRGAREEADLSIRRGKDKALEIRELSTAILNLANARKADVEVNQQWYDLHLTALRHQVDLINTLADMGQPGADPAAAAGQSGGAPGDSGGPQGGGPPGMAPPSGVAGGPAVPPGLPGPAPA